MLEFMRNKLVSVAQKDASTLVVHAVLDDTIYSLELELEVRYPDLILLAITGRWKRWTTPVCPRSLDFLDQARGFCLGPGIDDQIHKTIGRTSCRHFANLLIDCCYALQEAARFIQWQAASKADPNLDMATFMRTGIRAGLEPSGSGTTDGSPLSGGLSRPHVSREAGKESPRESTAGAAKETDGKAAAPLAAAAPRVSPAPGTVRDSTGFVLDLHMHTFPASKCASSSVDDMILEAKRLGLGGVCLTDHNVVWSQDQVRELMNRHGMRIFRGNEIVTDQGDMVVFGFHENIQGVIKLAKLKGLVDAAGGFIIAAHPFRGFLTFGVGQLGLTPEKAMERDMFRHVHAIEILNGKVTASENSLAAQVAQGLNLPATGGSDAHDVTTLGVYATRFDMVLNDEQDLVRALRSGHYQPVSFR
ncbi:MAG: PHP domain-containing protein [Pseudomonadota bacterium]